MTGAFASARNGGRVVTSDGTRSFAISYTGSDVVLSDFQVVPEPGPMRCSGWGRQRCWLCGDAELRAVKIGARTHAHRRRCRTRSKIRRLPLGGFDRQQPASTQEHDIDATSIPPKDERKTAILPTSSAGAYGDPERWKQQRARPSTGE